MAVLEEGLDSASEGLICLVSNLVANSNADCFPHTHQTNSTGKPTPEYAVTSLSKEHETFLLGVSCSSVSSLINVR